jgi:hypothetical protein
MCYSGTRRWPCAERRRAVRTSAALSPFSGSSTGPGSDDAHLHGFWLLVGRLGWLVLTLLIVILNLIMIPRFYAVLQAPCQPAVQCAGIQLTSFDQQLLHQTGLSLGFIAGYQVMLNAVVGLVYTVLGALIFWRRSTDRMALFCAYMLVIFGGASFTSILQDTLWLTSPVWYVLLGGLDALGQISFMVFFLLFPTGSFVPRWTRWLVLGIVLYWVVQSFSNTLSQHPGITPSNLVFIALLLCVVGAQVYRYRRVSTPRERLQTKWVVFGFAVGIIGFVLLLVSANLFLPPAVLQSSVMSTFVADTALYGCLLLVPTSIAIAILRSHLYDIDIIINRTLVYGSLTGILGILYAGLIVGLESLTSIVTGTTSEPIALVISTLVIAALFQPLRGRLQTAIDRRFYRQKYDAQKTLEAFGATLRQEINLEQLSSQLLAAVQETVQPAQVALWLRAPDQATGHPAHLQQVDDR